MSTGVEQATWAVILLMRASTAGAPGSGAPRHFDAALLDAAARDVALGAFSRAIHRGNDDQRVIAVEALVWLGDRRAISPLVRGLRDPLWQVRHAAADGLARLHPLPDWSLEPLCNRADDPEPAVRAEAARALGSLESLQSLPPRVSALDDHSRCVRLAATWALEKLGRAAIFDAAPAKRLERLLDCEGDPYIAYAAYWALGAQGGSIGCRAAFRWSDWGQTVWKVVAGT